MDTPHELEPELYAQICKHCDAGNDHMDRREYHSALEAFKEAWKLVPEPQTDWSASVYILAGEADANFFLGEYDKVVEALRFAAYCPGGVGNPFVHLRLGQALYELGDLDRGLDQLMRAYIVAREDAFRGEDPKYFNFLKSKVDLEPGEPGDPHPDPEEAGQDPNHFTYQQSKVEPQSSAPAQPPSDPVKFVAGESAHGTLGQPDNLTGLLVPASVAQPPRNDKAEATPPKPEPNGWVERVWRWVASLWRR